MTFERDRYVHLTDVVSPDVLAVARAYTIFDESLNFAGDDGQVPGSHSRYADPMMEALLLHLLPAMEEATGLRLYPTYSYYRVYRRGAELKPHVDRPSCEISASLCIGYTDDSVEWPLYVEDVPYVMKPGDLIAYRGMELNHYRYPLQCPHSWTQSQVFLHYVDADGPHSEWKFDKRGALGVAR